MPQPTELRELHTGHARGAYRRAPAARVMFVTMLAVAAALVLIILSATATAPGLVAGTAFALLAGLIAGIRGCLEPRSYRHRHRPR